MPRHRYCVAPGCHNAVTPTIAAKYVGSMHAFPNKKRFPERFVQWVQFCERDPEWQPSQSSYICGDHFVANVMKLYMDQAPTIRANMLEDKCLHTDDLPTSLPLDTTLELFQDSVDDIASSSLSSPKKNGLPADRTLDSISEEIDVDMDILLQDYSLLELSLANVHLVCVPAGWTMVMFDVKLVLFAEINKQTSGINRSVGFNAQLGISSTVYWNENYHDCDIRRLHCTVRWKSVSR